MKLLGIIFIIERWVCTKFSVTILEIRGKAKERRGTRACSSQYGKEGSDINRYMISVEKRRKGRALSLSSSYDAPNSVEHASRTPVNFHLRRLSHCATTLTYHASCRVSIATVYRNLFLPKILSMLRNDSFLRSAKNKECASYTRFRSYSTRPKFVDNCFSRYAFPRFLRRNGRGVSYKLKIISKTR